MSATDAVAGTGAGGTEDRRSWRPQGFGRRYRARDIPDPLVEPLWAGIRVLAHVQGGSVAIDDEYGDPASDEFGDDLDELVAIEAALLKALDADSAVLDGYLTPQARRAVQGAALHGLNGPTATGMAAQMLVGGAFRPRAARVAAELEAVPDHDLGGPLAFVAVDLLELDGDPLLDVPLLERKRLLESVLDESDLVRRSAYVRPPIHVWLASWRALGFSGLAYKSANSRYRPGEPNEAWATAPIPRQ